MRRHSALYAGSLMILAAAGGFSQTPAAPPFVTAAQLQAAAILPDPPAADSAETAADLALLHRLESTRTPAQVIQAQKDDGDESMFAFRDVLGAGFNRESLPRTAELSDHVHANEGVIVNPAKQYFHRPRPYTFDSGLKPVCKTKTDPTDFAYPSGHATSGYLEALVLAAMVPEQRNAILARADDYAHNRLVCGVHWSADIAASRTVAYAVIGLMMNNPEFKHEFDAARSETRLALGLK